MPDCIDARIDSDMITTIKRVTVANGYNTAIGTVERLRTNLCINNRYPYTLIIQMEPDEVQQWANLQESNLNYIIWHFDGKNDHNQTLNGEFVYRLRNVHADIQKALRSDPSRGGLAQNTEIKSHGFGMFVEENSVEPGAYVTVEIQRIIDPNDPYLLA